MIFLVRWTHASLGHLARISVTLVSFNRIAPGVANSTPRSRREMNSFSQAWITLSTSPTSPYMLPYWTRIFLAGNNSSSSPSAKSGRNSSSLQQPFSASARTRIHRTSTASKGRCTTFPNSQRRSSARKVRNWTRLKKNAVDYGNPRSVYFVPWYIHIFRMGGWGQACENSQEPFLSYL